MTKSQNVQIERTISVSLYVLSTNKVYFLSIVNRTIFVASFCFIVVVCLPLLFRIHFSCFFFRFFCALLFKYNNIKITLKTNLNRHHRHQRLRIFSVYAFGAFAF